MYLVSILAPRIRQRLQRNRTDLGQSGTGAGRRLVLHGRRLEGFRTL
jgi:hypothetical protein